MLSIRPERQIGDKFDVGGIQDPIKMGKQVAIAGHFPFQGVTEAVAVNFDQYQTLNACKMLRCGLHALAGGRKMDEPVFHIDFATAIDTGLDRRVPFRHGAYFVDESVCHGVTIGKSWTDLQTLFSAAGAGSLFRIPLRADRIKVTGYSTGKTDFE